MAGVGLMLKAGGNISPCRFVKVSAANTVTQCSAGTDLPIGVSGEATYDKDSSYHADTTSLTVQIMEAGRTCKITAGAAFSAGALLMADASGRGITATTTNYAGALALAAASAAGELVDVVVLGPTYKV